MSIKKYNAFVNELLSSHFKTTKIKDMLQYLKDNLELLGEITEKDGSIEYDNDDFFKVSIVNDKLVVVLESDSQSFELNDYDAVVEFISGSTNLQRKDGGDHRDLAVNFADT